MPMRTNIIHGRTFNRQGRRLFGTHDFAGLRIESCAFENCSFGYNSVPFSSKRDSVKNSELVNCKISRCLLGPAEIRSTRISNLSGDMLIFWGALFDQVVLEGKIGPLMLHGIPQSSADTALQEMQYARVKKFYADVPWALDISESKSDDFAIRTGAIPLSLVRRDVNSQFLITDSGGRLSRSDIDSLSVSRYTKVVLEVMADEGLKEALLVAPKLDKSLYGQVLQDANVLARNGMLS